MTKTPDRFPSAGTRYSAREFPAYRHVPGRALHPATDPDGRSVRETAQNNAAPDDANDRFDAAEAFLYGVDLYNAGFWWEAHEAWEAVWLDARPNSAQHHGLRGMIQVANAHLKIHMGRTRAFERLRADVEECFGAALLHVPDLAIHGFAVAPWAHDVRRYFETVGETGHDLSRYPYLTVT